MEERVHQEWALFRRRMGQERFVELVECVSALVIVTTTDPDFDETLLPLVEQPNTGNRRIRGMKVRVTLPERYPDVKPDVKVLSRHERAESLQTEIDSFLADNEGAFVLRPLCKWVDKKIGEWRPADDLKETPEEVMKKEKVVIEKARKQREESALVAATSPNIEGVKDLDVLPESQWTLREQQSLEDALKKFPKTMPKHERWRKIFKAVEGKSKAECVARFNFVRNQLRQIHEKAAQEFQRKEAEEREVREKQIALRTAREEARQKAGSTRVHVWTDEDQKLLDNALSQFPSSMEKNERWRRIAAVIPGKSKRECIERFKQVREQLLKEKEREERLANGEPDDLVPDFAPEERGVRATLEDLHMQGIGVMFCSRMKLECSCSNCRTRTVFDVYQNSSTEKSWCNACGALLEIKFNPALIHGSSSGVIGFFDVSNLIVEDLVDADLKAGCFKCGKFGDVKGTVRAKASEVNCFNCHERIRVLYSGWSAKDLQAAKTASIHEKVQKKVSSKSAKPKRDPRIQQGKPLPSEGTCRHYQKSHRWLRFPCCGVAYPCDICHETEGNCSEPKWANRQICGFCASEQPYSKDKPCVKCGKLIASEKHSAHWEGGKGQRNRMLMSNKDNKKFKGSKLKTASNKQNRVGPKSSS